MVGIKDVAREAGVSIATVSYVINGTRKVSSETVSMVENAARKLNYTPNDSARALRTRRIKAIAFITHRITNDYFPDVIEAAENVFSENGYSLLLGLSQNIIEDELNEFRNMIRRQVSGIIIAPSQIDYNYRTLCRDEKFPLIFVDRLPVNQPADSIICDNYFVTYDAVCELIRRGHRTIALINAKYDQDHREMQLSTLQDRLRAYQAALADNGLSEFSRVYDNCVTTRNDGYRVMEEILANEEITACVICNGVMAQGVLRCLKEKGVEIPGRMALISVDAYNWSQLVTPTLSAIEQPTSEIGRIAAETMLERIKNPNMPFRKITLDSKLVLRESC